MESINELKIDLEEQSLRALLNTQTHKDCKLVAEGDSWFAYPLVQDIIDHLRQMGYAIKNHSKSGDTLENMVYGTGFSIADRVHRAINYGPISLIETLRSVKNLQPRFVLLSAGGNDVVGPELTQYLNHKRSGLPLFRESFFRGSIDGYIRSAIITFMEKVWSVDPHIHIIMHGYDYAIPNGTQYEFAGISFAGPWVLPAFAREAITDRAEQDQIIRQLVDIFNELLISLDNSHPNFHHIDLRGMFPDEAQWHNEIHLKSEEYAQVAALFHKKIVEILNYNPVTVWGNAAAPGQ
ncbi:hypothetical protein I2I11_00310 [Pontibacter sp. 172403-2]|uniref:hypothetical protein n=1 Tax=Pontibacter rufus TaxID=2791028 RepID=UPI0018AFBA6A|nr:hypothetical protein [Pontibacter sp. 172403-2]MBF9251727.1 hypothetical protein [Pontibacter sp. 172403-2]